MSVQKVIIHANNVEWQQEYLPRFTKGFAEGHGIRVIHKQEDTPDFTLSPSGRKLYIRNTHVIFANNSWKLTHTVCNKHDFPLLTVGRCLFGDRHDMVALGWDGFNGAANFMLEDEMPDDRWQKHGWELTTDVLNQVNGDPDGYVLVCGEYRETGKWLSGLREELDGEDVRFRSHPFKSDTVRGWQNAPHAGQDDIASLFPDCKAVITYDSIAGCDAALAGVPTICYGENAMARPVAYRSWTEFESDKNPVRRIDVQNWANRLAYCQWSHDEISNGEFWDHLKSRIVAT